MHITSRQATLLVTGLLSVGIFFSFRGSGNWPKIQVAHSEPWAQYDKATYTLESKIPQFDEATLQRWVPRDGLIGPDPRKSCCHEIAGISVEQVCQTYGSTEQLANFPTDNSSCTCADYLYCRLVVVTAISSNHFNEVQDMIAGVQHNLPSTQIIVYDLGLSADQKKDISAHCNVQLRSFNFTKYKHIPHVRKLTSYAWKPIITKEVSQEYEVILYGDASLRIYRPVTDLFPYLLTFPFVSGPHANQPIVALTDDSMVNYLGLNLTREEAYKQINFTLQTVYCIWTTRLIREKFLNNWVDCALHEECIAPKGSSPFGCHFNMLSMPGFKGEYIGCHRFDQSALNIILYREFGREIWMKLSPLKLSKGSEMFWEVKRAVTHRYKAKISQCTS